MSQNTPSTPDFDIVCWISRCDSNVGSMSLLRDRSNGETTKAGEDKTGYSQDGCVCWSGIDMEVPSYDQLDGMSLVETCISETGPGSGTRMALRKMEPRSPV